MRTQSNTKYQRSVRQHEDNDCAGSAKAATDKSAVRPSKAQTRLGGINPEDTAALETADFMMTTQVSFCCQRSRWKETKVHGATGQPIGRRSDLALFKLGFVARLTDSMLLWDAIGSQQLASEPAQHSQVTHSEGP